jgi:serine protease AprX
MRQRIRHARVLAVLVLLLTTLAPSPSAQLLSLQSNLQGGLSKLDPILRGRAFLLTGQSRVIVRVSNASSMGPVLSLIHRLGGVARHALPVITGESIMLPNAALAALVTSPLVVHLSSDRATAGAMERTGQTVGATAVREELGVDGSGVGVAIIDSGVTSWHDDLSGNNRVVRFVDFVNGRPTSYDDYGHGSHVSGIVAGNGFDSGGARSGMAPGADLIELKVIGESGSGHISDVIAALEYAVLNKETLNIRVVNLSVTAGVYESYDTDPLTLAALAAVKAGIVVVAAAGNNGRSAHGDNQYGGITAPGNAPWVLTVGASSHMGTVDRSDDTIAAFSSRGPSAVDASAKPDLVAPGVGIESISDPDSAFYSTKAAYLLGGTVQTPYLPYLSLSGTSMATPVVSGTVALMLQANPALTPNAVKAILQYTAQVYPDWDPLTQGAGFLNARGAVELARFLGDPSSAYPLSSTWGMRLLWGNRLFQGGQLTADANAWWSDVTWGAMQTGVGQTVDWGVTCATLNCDGGIGTEDSWGTTAASRNVVWGTACNEADCQGPWSASAVSSDDDTVVWGTATDDDTVVWGTATDDDTVVWGTSCSDPSCQPVLWGRQ